MRGVVLIHGGFHGAWCWAPIIERLEAKGVAHRAPDLQMRVLADDIAIARAAIDDLAAETGQSVVLAGHSYGGIVMSGQSNDAPVSHLVFATAVVAEEGESIVDVAKSGPHEESALATVTEMRGDLMYPIAGPIAEVLYNDCSPEDIANAVAQLRPQTLEAVTTGSPNAFWRHVPSTFILCELDRALPLEQQRSLARRANATTVTLPSGHSVFYTFPDELTEVLVALALE